ncbi:MAG: T9SS type A sorting domain-containing protein [Bacteroidetes bacterium]|nr:T9SS type A sorting domain-containing protein [Bacteroidota bacterium]
MKKQLLSLLVGVSVATMMNAQAYIPNAGFETWQQYLGEPQEPQGWISPNIFASPAYNPANPTVATAAGSPDNYQGTYSCKIVTKTLVQNPDTNNIPNTSGYVLTGQFSISAPNIRPGYATAQRPATFTYYAKYSPVNTDTAWAIVTLTHWNTSTNMRDTIGWGLDYIPSAIAAYTMRTFSINYLQTTAPDTCTIWFSSSSFNTPQVNSTFFVDALSFTGFVGINESATNNGVDVYPNPSDNITNFDVTDNSAVEVVVYDMTGRDVKKTSIVNKHAQLNSYTLPAGMYSYAIINKNGEELNRGKFSVTQ